MPDIIDQQAACYDSQLYGFRKRQYTYAALLYLAFRVHGLPRPLQMIGPKFEVGREITLSL
jgi:hypothetical protein